MEKLSIKKSSMTTNPVESYEAALKKRFKAEYCISLSSGTAALIVALHALGVGRNKTVALPPTAPLCTAYPILYAGSTISFVDIQDSNLGLNLRMLEEEIRKLDAIVEVPMWGYPFDAVATRELADFYKLPLIFDLAHCAGTTFIDMPLSKYCDIACFSTQKNKIFSTGEGGFILTDNEEYYRRAKLFSRMGELNGADFGVNFKLSPLLAKIGKQSLSKLDKSLVLRKANRDAIINQLSNSNLGEYGLLNRGVPSYQRLLLQTLDQRTGLSEHLQNAGFETDKVKYNIKPLYAYPILKKFHKHCPNTETFLSTFATISVHQEISNDEFERLLRTLNSFK
jgi:dTDP-4-amino-4,6-dideoxygalactose transaminase